MELEEIMQQKTFVVVGDTVTDGKYACKIKNRLKGCGYEAYGVGRELSSINEVDCDIDVIDLCINPAKGLDLIKECQKPFKCVVIQPGAESAELCTYLRENKLPYIEDCLLVGMNLYSKN